MNQRVQKTRGLFLILQETIKEPGTGPNKNIERCQSYVRGETCSLEIVSIVELGTEYFSSKKYVCIRVRKRLVWLSR